MNANPQEKPDSIEPEISRPGAGMLTDALLARPPLTVRAAALVAQRRRSEARFRPNSPNWDETSPVIWWRGIGMALLRRGLMLAGLYRRGQRNALDLRLAEREFVISGLPQDFDGFRILQISDLHLPRRFPLLATQAAALLEGVEVDLCVLSGDYRWGYYGPVDHVAVQLREILSGLKSRHGTVACIGNHDTMIVAETLENAGIPVLFNEGVAIHEGKGTLWVCGIDDPHIYKCDRLDLALREAPVDAPVILLAHTPERICEAEQAGVALYLTGHTHGGQIRLPLLGAVTKNASCRRDQVMGSWRFGRLQGYTSTGLGTTDLPVRFNCPPEAAVITLRRGDPSAS